MGAEATVPIAVALITTTPAIITALVAVLVQNTRLGRRLRTVEGHTSTAAATEFSTPLTARDPVTGDTLSTIEVRYRDHGLHQWLTPVHTITL